MDPESDSQATPELEAGVTQEKPTNQEQTSTDESTDVPAENLTKPVKTDGEVTDNKPEQEEESVDKAEENGVNGDAEVHQNGANGDTGAENDSSEVNEEAKVEEEPVDVEMTENKEKSEDDNQEQPEVQPEESSNEQQAEAAEDNQLENEKPEESDNAPVPAEPVPEETNEGVDKEEGPAESTDTIAATETEAVQEMEQDQATEETPTNEETNQETPEAEIEQAETNEQEEPTIAENAESSQEQPPAEVEGQADQATVESVEEVNMKEEKNNEDQAETIEEIAKVVNGTGEVLENVTDVIDQVTDQIEENLDNFTEAPITVKKDVADVNDEQILVDDDNMVVTQITSIEELVGAGADSNGHTQVITVVPPKTDNDNVDQFTEIEDLIIHALETISPFDAKFISEHMVNRDEHQIERRLTDHNFRKLSFTFQKIPFLIFELIFIGDDNVRERNLMLLTSKRILQLKSKQPWVHYGPGVETIEMRQDNNNRFGIDTGKLSEFIITNIPNMHMPYLRRNVKEIEGFLEASEISFRRNAPASNKRDLKHLLNKIQSEITMESLRLEGMPIIKIDEDSNLHLQEEHNQMLVKIVKAVGRNHWEEVTKLLIAVFEYEVDVDIDDEEIFDKIRVHYETNLDTDLASGPFTEAEDKCIIYMYKYWSKIMEDDVLWAQIARHLEGRTANQVKNRFLRSSSVPTDLTLENILSYPDDPSNPATFNNDLAHMFALKMMRKGLAPDMELTTKLQHEDQYLVMGTRQELFILPCKYTSVKCYYPGLVEHTFTYDPSRPPQQFITFIKLTFSNGLKKLGLLDDPAAFNFNNIEYTGDTIHQIAATADENRLIMITY